MHLQPATDKTLRMGDFTHLNETGSAALVDVSQKQLSHRIAHVEGCVRVSATCVSRLNNDALLEISRTARLAAIQAAKQTYLLVPLCHQVQLSHIECEITFSDHQKSFFIHVKTKAKDVTGVEMEAMCAASIAGTTIYDMIKAVDPEAEVGPFRLVEKHGGKNGVWKRSS